LDGRLLAIGLSTGPMTSRMARVSRRAVSWGIPSVMAFEFRAAMMTFLATRRTVLEDRASASAWFHLREPPLLAKAS
jgi:hypothetical protein